jgi:transposase, IS5 family
MQGQSGFWDVEDRLKELSAEGDPLEKLAATVDFEMFRPVLRRALGRSPGGKGGRPGFDPVLKFKMLVLQALHGLSLAQTELHGAGPAELDAVLRAWARRHGS